MPYEAFEELCSNEYLRVVRTAFLITGDREEARDLAQEAFVRAYERWDVVSQLDDPAAWLQRVVGNLALSWRRRQKYRKFSRVQPEVVDEPAWGGPDPELMLALRALTPAQRTVIILRYYADQSSEDVAKALHKRPGTVRALTSQALQKLRQCLLEAEVHDEP
jgi:RNA polymerase sigma-70 factor (sigma-E family)